MRHTMHNGGMLSRQSTACRHHAIFLWLEPLLLREIHDKSRQIILRNAIICCQSTILAKEGACIIERCLGGNRADPNTGCTCSSHDSSLLTRCAAINKGERNVEMHLQTISEYHRMIPRQRYCYSEEPRKGTESPPYRWMKEILLKSFTN